MKNAFNNNARLAETFEECILRHAETLRQRDVVPNYFNVAMASGFEMHVVRRVMKAQEGGQA